ncbi:hypothetical protein PSH58_03385 [Pseudomonas hefeiensis]|uniref:Uncharacterized protein n=1 Tax=Pseudomonas hefeiensis TaxID=2738125 RepID=A0ABY9GCM8_9PSED|nr:MULTISPECIES: hypothetical protein [unclassified Pseudomonas]WLH13422.1 hypothetical protein PSH57_03390 [Pseudomonas sp. FP205]WLH96478.1 hypothetical protein PSH58_03385 [Pseudomonas sp. FP53]WLI40757.1 hypothetical protein PSH74_03390 [Pseudomonas sp. FP821]
MSTVELIASHEQQLIDAELLLASLNEQWESACRAGEDVAALEDQIDTTARLTKRLSLRLEALQDQKVSEATQAKIDAANAQAAEAMEAVERLVMARKSIAQLVEKMKPLIDTHNAAFQVIADRSQLAGHTVSLAAVRKSLEAIQPLDMGNVAAITNLMGTKQTLDIVVGGSSH